MITLGVYGCMCAGNNNIKTVVQYFLIVFSLLLGNNTNEINGVAGSSFCNKMKICSK